MFRMGFKHLYIYNIRGINLKKGNSVLVLNIPQKPFWRYAVLKVERYTEYGTLDYLAATT